MHTGLEFAYDNEGSSGHGWRLGSKICEVFALTARAFCGPISLQIEIDSPQHFTIRLFAGDVCQVKESISYIVRDLQGEYGVSLIAGSTAL